MKFSGRAGRRRRPSVYFIMLLSYISVLLLTLSSSIIYYFQIDRQITARTEISRQLLLTQLQTSVESDLAGVKKLVQEAAFDKNLHQYAKNLPGFTSKELQSMLSSRLYQKDIVYDYFVYIRETDQIITPTIKISSRQFYDIMYTFENMSYDEFRESYLDAVYFQEFMPLQELTLYDNESFLALPLLQTFPVGTTGEPLGQIVCLVNAKKLFENVNLIHQSTGSDVYVVNRDNALITASDDAPFLDASAADAPSGGRADKNAIYSKKTAESLGWSFIVRTPTALSLVENRLFLRNSLIIFAVYLIVGLILVHFLARKNYSPISEIQKLIRSNPAQDMPAAGSANEFEAIRDTLLHQFQRDKKLSGIINSQLPYVRRTMLDRMLKGLADDYEQTLERLREMGTDFPSRLFLVLSLEIAESSPFLRSGPVSDENLFLARMVISNVGNELFEPRFVSCYIDYEQHHCVFLLCPRQSGPGMPPAPEPAHGTVPGTAAEPAGTTAAGVAAESADTTVPGTAAEPSDETAAEPLSEPAGGNAPDAAAGPDHGTSEAAAMELSARLRDFLRQQFQIESSIGISSLRDSAAGIPLCFDEACKASQYSRLAQSETPVLFSDLVNLETNYYYPAETEYQLISSLKAGHFDQARTLIDKIFELNTRDKSLSPHAMKGLLFEINSTLSKQLDSIHIAKGEAPMAQTEYQEPEEPISLEAARIRYLEMIDQISVQKMEEPAISKPEKLAASIASYIEENAGCQWIDLNTLSEAFHVTPQYISSIFKKYRNQNIKDYISKVKLTYAKELILTTDMSVNEIAQRLGYAGEIGVIRLFKKYEGMTPGDFRNRAGLP